MQDLRSDLAARRLSAAARRAAPDPRLPERTAPARVLAGAALALAGVCLGIGTLLWVNGDPGPASADAVAQELTDDPVAEAPATEEPSVPPTQAPAAAPVPAALAPPAPAPSPAAQAPSSPVVAVTVLNNSRRTGLADRAAQRFAAGGWPVTAIGNVRGRIPATTVYFDPGLEASAQAFAATFDGLTRVLPRFPTLPARGIVVVVTREFPA